MTNYILSMMAVNWLILMLFPCVHPAPNIILFIADDLGYGDLGCYGNTSVRTPQIDSLARDGVKMTQHLTAASTCTPSRSAFLTGRYPVRTGMAATGLMRVNTWPYSSCGLPSSEITFAEQTKKAGYLNGYIGKWHLGLHKDRIGDFEHHPLKQGFDYFYGTIGTNLDDFGYETKVITNQRPYWYGELFTIWAVTAVALWSLLRSKYIGTVMFIVLITLWTVPIICVYLLFENFTLLSSFVHRNFELVEQPIRLAGLSQRLVNEGVEFMQNATVARQPFLLVMSWIHMHVAIKTAKQFEGRSQFGRYGDALEELDWSVGAILKALEQLGHGDNTLIYFTSDNGGHLEIGTDGGYNGFLKGGKTHGAPDGGIRVPGIVKWPSVLPRGKVTDEPTSLMDIYNLVSTAVGVNLPSDREIDGEDILPLLKGDVSVSPREFMFHYCGNRLEAARYRPKGGSKTWKLVTHEPNLIPGSKLCQFVCSCNFNIHLATPKLYDMTSDPGETTPIDSNSKLYRDITPIIQNAIYNHKNSIKPVESQFTWAKLAPKLTWQPCCNGHFPFNCECIDPKYSENFTL
ncbi:steryl-sulfatase-like isoform X2 [Ruditapes philippinarum]|uniref:steryl-sulfatase-like isoform X2 n=1 Tax=Ruditapes philippinarum TaxID=129788 RepID=UPI00295B52BF|nr:steryl-sulfatase-like isoform X2 [Ruditapes philippinarum]